MAEKGPYLVMYSPKALWLLPAALGSMALFVAAGKLLSYLRDVMSANIYETSVIHDYPEDFNEDDHTSFSSGERPGEEEGRRGQKDGEKGEGALNGGRLGRTGNNELDILRQFIRNKVIPEFQNQRDSVHGGNHFTVLILLENSSLHCLSGDWTFKPLRSTGAPYVDSRYRTRPPRDLYENYVVARPQLHRVNKILRTLLFHKVPEIFYEHAETMLLSEFDVILEMFEARRRCETKVIILFCWLFPCDRCTGELIRKFGHGFRTKHPAVQRVILVFAIFWCRMPFEKNWENFERLKESGFDVVRVKYKN